MRNPKLVDRLAPFEVFAGRELQSGKPLVARLVGRKFDQLLEGGQYDRPFDARFGKSMVKTLSYLVTTLGASLGFAERTELSLYAVANGGDARRLLSRVAGEGSAKLSLLLGQVATFETHLYELPDAEMALEYFEWRQEEAYGAAIERYCVHVLSQSGADASAVPRILDGLDRDEKVELLRQNALDFQTVPAWQRQGACVRLQPLDASNGSAQPSPPSPSMMRLLVDLNLPFDGEFGDYLRRALVQ